MVVWASVLVFATLACAGALWAWRAREGGANESWVAAREGLVRFSPGGTELFAWEAVLGAEATVRSVHLRFRPHTVPVVYRLGPPRELPPVDGLDVPERALAGVAPRVFVDMVELARTDPGARARLPTFEHPDGPPEAVLADLQR
ncbi:MAG: hypothetical protein R3F61_04075 [Myxococcota bacterium]